MKDFYEVWICSNHLDFNANTLLEAIDATFGNRETPVQADDVEALTTAFVGKLAKQWKAGRGWVAV